MRKGPDLPGQLQVVITLDSSKVKYELFNHWYHRAYAKYRQIEIPLRDLEDFNSQNDSLRIRILDNHIHLVDKRYRLNKKVKHQRLAVSVDHMRKISLTYELTKQYEDIHFELYEHEELDLPMKEFKTLMNARIKEKIKQRQPNTNHQNRGSK